MAVDHRDRKFELSVTHRRRSCVARQKVRRESIINESILFTNSASFTPQTQQTNTQHKNIKCVKVEEAAFQSVEK